MNNEIEEFNNLEYKQIKDSEFDILTVIKNDEYSYNIMESITKIVKDTSDFWMEIKNSKNSEKVNELSESISKGIKEIKQLSKDSEVDKKYFNIEVAELYIDFLESVIFNEQESNELKEKVNLVKKANKLVIDNPNYIVKFLFKV